MGTYTTNYQLLKAGDGTVDPVDDYVDVTSQLNRNLDLIDDFGHRACEYAYQNVSYSNLPTVGNRAGDKLYNHFDSSIAVWDGTQWKQTSSKAPIWTDVTLNAGFVNAGNVYNLGYFTADSGLVVNLRGRIAQTSNAAWTNGSSLTVVAAGGLPSPAEIFEFTAMGSFPGGRQAQFYKVSISTAGAMTITRYGSVAQSAGDASNSVDFEGLSYGLS